MEFIRTSLKDVVLVKPDFFLGERGKFIIGYNKVPYTQNGITESFERCFDVIAPKGTLRTPRFQVGEGESMLIHVLKGSLYDITLDLRKDSLTFGKWQGHFLDADENKILYVPKGVANGYLILEEDTIFSYQIAHSGEEGQMGAIRFDDEDLKLNWEEYIPKSDFIMTQADREGISLKEFQAKYI